MAREMTTYRRFARFAIRRWPKSLFAHRFRKQLWLWSKTASLVSEIGLLMMLVAGLTGSGLIRLGGITNPVTYLRALFEPAVATIVFYFVGAVAPRIIPGRGLSLPNCLTLPAVYSSLLLVTRVLVQDTEMQRAMNDAASRYSGLWLSMFTLAITYTLGSLVLCLIVMFSKRS